MLLKRPDLLRCQQCYLNGKWVGADDAALRRSQIRRPAKSSRYVPVMGAAETRRAIDGAKVAQKLWAARTAKDRAGILRKWFELMMANQEDLAIILTTEMGKSPDRSTRRNCLWCFVHRVVRGRRQTYCVRRNYSRSTRQTNAFWCSSNPLVLLRQSRRGISPMQ